MKFKSSFGVFIFIQMVGYLASIGAVCHAARIAGITFTKMPKPLLRQFTSFGSLLNYLHSIFLEKYITAAKMANKPMLPTNNA